MNYISIICLVYFEMKYLLDGSLRNSFKSDHLWLGCQVFATHLWKIRLRRHLENVESTWTKNQLSKTTMVSIVFRTNGSEHVLVSTDQTEYYPNPLKSWQNVIVSNEALCRWWLSFEINQTLDRDWHDNTNIDEDDRMTLG